MEVRDEKIAEAYRGASSETVSILNRMLGKDVESGSFVKTFDEAVASLGSDNPAVRRYRRKDREGDTETEAFERLRVVTEAVNRFYISVSPPPITIYQKICAKRRIFDGTQCSGSTHPRRRRT